MVVIFEQDLRPYHGRRFTWRPFLFRGWWQDRITWRIGWGLWSISFYPSPGLRDFFRHVGDGQTQWYERTQDDSTADDAD